MSEKPLILVGYDGSKTDQSWVACAALNNDALKMLVGYVGNDADEVYKMVSEQGYLDKHDKEIRAEERNKVLDEVYKIVAGQMIKHSTELDFNLETQQLILHMKVEKEKTT